MANLPPIPENISKITAPILIGSLFNYTLYGVLLAQVGIYHIAFPSDKAKLKLLVYTVFIVETGQVCLSGADIYYWFGDGYGNMLRLSRVHYAPIVDPLLGSIIAFMAQLFFCYRIWNLKKEIWWLCICIACISAAALVGGILGCISGIVSPGFGSHNFDKAVYMWHSGNAAADLIIAVTLTTLLLQYRRQDEGWTNSVLIRIIRLVVETNLLTAAVAILSLVLYAAVHDVSYAIGPGKVMGKLYSNALVVTLNNRVLFRRENPRGPVSSIGVSISPSAHLKQMSEHFNSVSYAGSREQIVPF